MKEGAFSPFASNLSLLSPADLGFTLLPAYQLFLSLALFLSLFLSYSLIVEHRKTSWLSLTPNLTSPL